MRRYSPVLKEKLLAKAFSPNPPSIVELAKESGISYTTLYSWVYMKRKKQGNIEGSPQRPKDWSKEAKFKAVVDTLNMTDAEKGLYCRKHGLYSHHLDEWKTLILAGLSSNEAREHKAEYKQITAENKQLKKELNRKEKALAEASALLILKKKADLIWGVEDEDD